MKSFSINSDPNSFILGWYMDDTQLCDVIIDWFKITDDKKPGVIHNEFGERAIDKSIKDSVDSQIPEGVLLDEYYRHLDNCLVLYSERYPLVFYGDNLGVLQKPNIQYYPPGGGFKIWHSERLGCTEPGASRVLAFMTYLNDVNDEGGTQFYHQKLTIRPEKGLTVIWPADWTYFHRGVPSPSEEKYIVTGWYNYVPNPTTNKKDFKPIPDPFR